MESFLLALNVAAPLFIMMLAGYILRLTRVASTDDLHSLNAIVFKLLLPMVLFKNIFDADMSRITDVRAVLFCIGAVAVTVTVLCFTVPRFVTDDARRGVVVQGMTRANIAIYGVPIAASILDGNIGIVTVVIACLVPVFNVISIITLELFRGGKPNARQILMNIIKNPLIIAVAVGFLFNIAGVTLPDILMKPVSQFAAATTPLSFIVLGGSFTFASAIKNRKALICTLLVKLIIMPLVWIAAAFLLGFRGVQMICVLIVTAVPTAVSSYPMACAMGGDGELASEIVVFTSALSVFTMFMWVYTLSSMGAI